MDGKGCLYVQAYVNKCAKRAGNCIASYSLLYSSNIRYVISLSAENELVETRPDNRISTNDNGDINIIRDVDTWIYQSPDGIILYVCLKLLTCVEVNVKFAVFRSG
jgi:hypothetical protein